MFAIDCKKGIKNHRTQKKSKYRANESYNNQNVLKEQISCQHTNKRNPTALKNSEENGKKRKEKNRHDRKKERMEKKKS